MRKNGLFLIILAVAILVKPSFALACDVRPYAKSYINQIQKAVGGEKPKVLVLNRKSAENVAFYVYTEKTIYIYKNDYKGSCVSETPYLKAVIAHEYSHHLEKSLKKVSNLKGEKLAYVAEHAIADQILGGAEYDNEMDMRYVNQYQKIKNFIRQKQIIALAKAKSQLVAMKKK